MLNSEIRGYVASVICFEEKTKVLELFDGRERGEKKKREQGERER